MVTGLRTSLLAKLRVRQEPEDHSCAYGFHRPDDTDFREHVAEFRCLACPVLRIFVAKLIAGILRLVSGEET